MAVAFEQLRSVISQTHFVGLAFDPRHRETIGGADFKHLELIDARLVFPGITHSGLRLAKNFDDIASSAAII